MAYYTNVGPLSGPLHSRAGYLAIGVLQARKANTTIGTAVMAGKDDGGLALWRLTVDTFDLPGLWVVVDREFRPTSGAASASSDLGP